MNLPKERPAFAGNTVHTPLKIQGLTVREYFAACAMQGMISNMHITSTIVEALQKQGRTDDETIIAKSARQYADALIAELNTNSEGAKSQ